jgi:hypothetical protein
MINNKTTISIKFTHELVSRLDKEMSDMAIGKIVSPRGDAVNGVVIYGDLDDLSNVFMDVVTGLVDEINNGDHNA